MSHITDVKLRVNDLDALRDACDQLGLVFKEGQRRHKWYGRFVGDARPPQGLAVGDYGKCEHAIALKDPTSDDYEIGVVKALDRGAGYDLVVDTFCQQRLLAAVDGEQMNGLRREYAAAVVQRKHAGTLAKRGFVATRENLDGGRIRLRLRKR